MASVCIERTMHSSSTIRAVWGSSSLTQVPLLPWRAKSNCEPAIGNDFWCAVMPVSRWPLRIDSGSSSPFIVRRRGL